MTKGLACLFAAAAAAVAFSSLDAAAQRGVQAPAPPSVCPDDEHAKFHACAVEAAKTFNPPRAAHGAPDFNGLWRRSARAHEDMEDHPRTADDGGGPSVVVDPPDRKVPMQPWADARRRDNAQKYLHHNAACLLSGVPVTMYMTGLFRFQQTRDYLVVQSEEAHQWRSIPLDGRPHVGTGIRLWQGDSRGRWQGNTLVIDTTNQRAQGFLDQRGRFITDEARVVERLTLVDADTLHYQATIEDPNVFTRPFTIAIAFRRNIQPDVELWEEACYEENETSMEHFTKSGYALYPGISGVEARAMKAAWEAAQGKR